MRLVLNAEKMVIAEARRAYTSLSLFGYRIDQIKVPGAVLRAEITILGAGLDT